VIFSLSKSPVQTLSFEISETDIFCFFHSANAVNVAEKFYLHAILTSLKMKKNVLILEENIPQAPSLDCSQRWQNGEKFLWLAPRSASVLLEAQEEISASYKFMKNYLTSRK
jgi:hypothetical protein